MQGTPWRTLPSVANIAIATLIRTLFAPTDSWATYAILFNHYGDRPQQDVQWLVESMATLNVAISPQFSTAGTIRPF